MGIIYKVSAKQLLDIRNKIVLQTAIPLLLKKGFSKTPYYASWYGRDNHQNFHYELCRLSTNSLMEIIDIYVARGDRWIQIHLNIFKLTPSASSLEQLANSDSLQFNLPPNNLTKMRLRCDDVKGPPLFSPNYMSGHRLKRFFTKHGLSRRIKSLTKTIEADLNDIDSFVKRWHKLHRPTTTDWSGRRIVYQE